MDDLDAGLFGTSSTMPKPSTSTAPAVSKPILAPAVETKAKPIVFDTKPVPIISGKSKKSELLAELFGAEEEQNEPSLSFQLEPISGQYPPRSVSPVFKIDSLTKGAEERGANVQDYNQASTEPYVPMLSAGDRRKRTITRNKPIEDFWGEFLQPESIEPKSVDIIQSAPEEISLEIRPPETTRPTLNRSTAEIRGPSFQNITHPPAKPVTTHQNTAKFELTDEIKEKILSMIKKEQEINNKTHEENFEIRLTELGSENNSLREEIEQLKLQSSQHENLIEVCKILEKNISTHCITALIYMF